MADLTTLANVKQWLGIPTGTTTNDALLNRLISAASDFIQTWCGRTFALTSYIDVRDGHGGRRMSLANYPIVTVTEVLVDYRQVPASNGQGGAGWVNDSGCVTLIGYNFTREKSNVAISYSAGFAQTPMAVSRACDEMIGQRFREMDRIGIVSKQLAGEVVTFSQKDMSSSVETVLKNFRKVVPT